MSFFEIKIQHGVIENIFAWSKNKIIVNMIARYDLILQQKGQITYIKP